MASSAPVAEADAEVFEIVDFTNASAWETLVSDVERCFRSWGLGTSAGQLIDRQQSTAEVTMLDRAYTLCCHWSPPGAAPLVESAVSPDLYRRLREGGFEGDVPPAMAALLSTSGDFDDGAHVLTRRFGVHTFVTLAPAAAGYSSKVSQSEARLLLGGLAVAVANTQCSTPVFVQVNEAHRQTFLGYSAAQDTHTSFDGIWLPVPPPAYSHLSGLSELFRSKLVEPSPKVWISARFTYARRNWFHEHADLAGPWHGAAAKEDRYAAPVKLPCGSTANPLHCLWWATSWRRFREDSVMDNAVFSELNPGSATMWFLTVEWARPDPPGLLSSILRDFASACRSKSTVDGLLGERAFVDETEMETSKARGLTALDNLARSRGLGLSRAGQLLDVRRVGKRLGDRLGDIVERTVEKTVIRVAAGRVADRKDLGLTEEDLDGILRYMFVDTTAAEGEEAAQAASEMIGARTVPPGSLLSVLAVYLGLVNKYSGGLRGVALLWSEFVLELRWHWEHLKPVPLVSVDEVPEMRYMLLHQKLQMLNCCIIRQTRRNDLLQGGGGGGGDGGGASPLEVESPDTPLSSDEEFKEAEEGGAAAADSGSAAGEGIREQSERLRLLASGAPMQIPITQDPGPMTEDMMEKELEAMTNMGDSGSATEMRSRMQSLSLRSDMSAFKAANPGCQLADFVRWHSPRDWLVAEGRPEVEGRLSERMAPVDCLWQRLWEEARPTPVSRQPQLFDTTTQAEKVLAFFEAASPSEFLWQLFPALLRASHARLAVQAAELDGSSASTLEALRHAATGFGRQRGEDQDRLDDIVDQFAAAEAAHSRCQSLERLLGADRRVIAHELLAGREAPVVEAEDRRFVQDLFQQQADGSSRLLPERKEFVFRTVSATPNETCRPVAHRMYCLLGEHDFRVDGAFSEDDSFRYSAV